MLSATSFQIILSSGQNWQNDLELYVLGAVFLASSVGRYALFRLKPSFYVLSFPWIFFGLAFFLIGLPSVHPALHGAHNPLSAAATWCYAAASAAAFAFFGLNFGEEAGAATEVWILRTCMVQGTQQIWVAALWYWGDKLKGAQAGNITPWWIVIAVWPLSVMSFVFAYLMLYGLPECYRQTPPKVPNFLRTLFRRKLVLWFLGSEILRDYWLSGVRLSPFSSPAMDTDGLVFQPHGRNWGFLWSSRIPELQILPVVIASFIGVWGLLLDILTHFSETHTWLLPVFAVDLGAPRWCQVRTLCFVTPVHHLMLVTTAAVGYFFACPLYSVGW